MDINLPPALDAMVRDHVASGRYRDESEVVSDALRLLEAQTWDPDWRKLGPALDEAEADLAAGRYVEVTSIKELRAKVAETT